MSRSKVFSVVVLSGGIFLACLFLLSELDFPALLFRRSLNVPFMERLGDVGDRLGNGVTLVMLCAGLWGVGWFLRRQAWQRAGLDTFVAYVLAGLAVQLLKHLIGRPRPRFAHHDVFGYGPSLQVGFDAFPSGHTTASFAVSAVLARAFPAWAWAWYGGAFFVGVSRVVRGSHFLTDILVGAVLGFLIGYVWARPLGEWPRHAARAWAYMLPFIVGGCAMVWNAFSHPVDSLVARGMFWAGLALCVGGTVVRMARTGQGPGRPVPRILFANGMIALGMAISLHTWWIVAATLMACVVWWIMDHDDHVLAEAPKLSREIWLAGLWVIVMATVHGLYGIVPLR